jgi:Ca-activated chloride channel family protein
LLTDGVNTSGYIKPLTAAAIARAFDIKVYTIGIGSLGEALKPVRLDSEGKFEFAMGRVEMDEDLLEEIAQTTGGQYFRATSAENLAKIYEEIDLLEKTEIEVTQIERYGEHFHRFVSVAFLFILVELGLKYTLLRSIP